MFNRIERRAEQNSVQSLQTKVTEQEKKLTDLQTKHATEISKLNAEISGLKIQMKAIDEQNQQLTDLKLHHFEEKQKLNETMIALKHQEIIVEEQNIKINDLQKQNTTLKTEINQLKSEQLTKDIILNKILLDESQRGNLDEINGAISLRANINAQDAEGRTALHLAVFNDQKKAAKLLLSKSIMLAKSPNIFIIPDNYGLTPMQYAAQKGLVLELPWLYKQGKKIDGFYKDPNEFDKVYNVGTVDAKKCLANIKLLDSAKTESIDGIENTEGLLDALAKGADINYIGPNGTALHVAIFCKHPAITQLLVERGADPTILHYNETALDMAITLKKQTLVSLLATPFLIFSATHGSIKGMETALDVGALLDGKDLYGQTALHKAVLNNKIEIIKYLLKKYVDAKLDIGLPDNEKTTPFELAKKLHQTLTTKKGEIIGTDYYLGTRYGRYDERFKNLSSSRFSFVKVIGGTVPESHQPSLLPTTENNNPQQKLKK
jgi:ankyrin repeat protein